MIEIAPTAKICHLADIDDPIRGSRTVIGPSVSIGSFEKLISAGEAGDVFIGEDSEINAGTVIYTGNGLNIGRGALIAANCTFASTSHAFESRKMTIRAQRFQPSRGGITIDDDVRIGANCVVLDGTVIRRGVVVAAGSLVRQEHGVYGGNPIHLITERKG